MMRKKIIKIYAAIQGLHNGQSLAQDISIHEADSFLKCKFWHKSQEQAQLFDIYYYAPLCFSNIIRVIGILSGEYLKNNQCLAITNIKIAKAWRLFHDLKQDKLDKESIDKINQSLIKANENIQKDYLYNIHDIEQLKPFKPIIDAILEDCNHKIIHTIDELLAWAENHKAFLKSTIKQAREQILLTRRAVFANSVVLNKITLRIIKSVLNKLSYLSYQDAKSLFFPEQDLITNLTMAIEKNELTTFNSIENPNLCYFETKRLIKWLMKKKYFPEQLIEDFKALKLESIKESPIDSNIKFVSLETLISKDISRDKILQDAINKETFIFLKYPRENIDWRDLENYESSRIDKSDFDGLRYKGFGRLKKKREEDTQECRRGGVTLDMLLHNEKPSHYLSKYRPHDFEIELVPTEEEAKHALQPYVKISPDNLSEAFLDKNLMLTEEDASYYLFHSNSLNKADISINLGKESQNFETSFFHIDLDSDSEVLKENIQKLKQLENQSEEKAWDFLKNCFTQTFQALCAGTVTIEAYETQSYQLSNILAEFKRMGASSFLEMLYDFSVNIMPKNEKISNEDEKAKLFDNFFYSWKRKLANIDMNFRGLNLTEMFENIYRYLCNIYCALKYHDIHSHKFMKVTNIEVIKSTRKVEETDRHIINNLEVNSQQQNKAATSYTESQILTRPAIKRIYEKYTNNAWDKRFEREKSNGLADCKVKDGSKKHRYYQDKLHSWLIENGRYSPTELSKFKVPNTSRVESPNDLKYWEVLKLTKN